MKIELRNIEIQKPQKIANRNSEREDSDKTNFEGPKAVRLEIRKLENKRKTTSILGNRKINYTQTRCELWNSNIEFVN